MEAAVGGGVPTAATGMSAAGSAVGWAEMIWSSRNHRSSSNPDDPVPEFMTKLEVESASFVAPVPIADVRHRPTTHQYPLVWANSTGSIRYVATSWSR